MTDNNKLFSIITPVFNPDHEALRLCAHSVLQQTYQKWEWCLVDDNSTDPWVWKYLQRLARRHDNIKIARRSVNGGISQASNDAISMAAGEFLAFLDNDDELHPDALSAVNHELFVEPTLEFIYTDEDKIDENGNHYGAFHKPDWSPEQLLCHNYCCHLSVVRTDLVRRIGGLRSQYDGSQDHDLLLRLSDSPLKAKHIRRVLYHWRVSATSTAGSTASKPYAVDAARDALSDTCARRGISAEIVPTRYGHHRVKRHLNSKPRTSIIIPTCGTIGSIWGMKCAYIENFLASSLDKTTYEDVEYVIVFDSFTPPDILDRIKALPLNIKLVEFSEPFNFSLKCNLGAIHSTGQRLIFANDDMEVITGDWIERLICFLEDESIGAVGPLLLLENGLVESAGHTNRGPKNFLNETSRSFPYGVWWPLLVNREVSGVTGACLGIRRETFFSVGGFSEIFPANFNDVDLCHKLIEDGYRIIWTPDAELYHFEMKSRSKRVTQPERDNMMRYLGRVVGRDRVDPYLPRV